MYDGVCHDLPLFSFTVPAKYCYRAISSFIKFVTSDCSHPSREGTATPPSPVSATNMELPVELDQDHPDAVTHNVAISNLDLNSTDSQGAVSSPHAQATDGAPATPVYLLPPTDASRSSSRAGSTLRSRKSPSPSPTASGLSSPTSSTAPEQGKHKHIAGLEQTIYSSTQPFNRPAYVDNMVRERIGVTGVVRPLEPEGEMSIFKLDVEDVGLIKEAPVKRYLAGSESLLAVGTLTLLAPS